MHFIQCRKYNWYINCLSPRLVATVDGVLWNTIVGRLCLCNTLIRIIYGIRSLCSYAYKNTSLRMIYPIAKMFRNIQEFWWWSIGILFFIRDVKDPNGSIRLRDICNTQPTDNEQYRHMMNIIIDVYYNHMILRILI